MNRKKGIYYLTWILRLSFAILLIYAAWSKILNPFTFAKNVSQYRIIGLELSIWTAIFIPYLELVIAICLLSGIWLISAIWMNASLMFLFLILIIQAFARGLDIDCGCFTQNGEANINWLKLSENILFFVGSIILLFLTSLKGIKK